MAAYAAEVPSPLPTRNFCITLCLAAAPPSLCMLPIAARITTEVKQKLKEGVKPPAKKKKDPSSSLDEDEFDEDLIDDEQLLKELEEESARRASRG